MLETPHVVVGAAIAFKLGNPALALPLALGSHFVLEMVPHWNPHLNREKKLIGRVSSTSFKIVVVDATLALLSGTTIALLAYPDLLRVTTILLASFLAVLPDLIEAPYFFLNNNSELIKKWIKWQKKLQTDAAVIPGLLTQLITIIAGVWWILT